MIVRSFPPIVGDNPILLILGTMPGNKSLEMKEYYAHRQNAFWKIMFKLFDVGFSDRYQDKTALLIDQKIALWDTLMYCEREGSADAKITQEIPNDFVSFFNAFPSIEYICFNGTSAERFFNRYSKMKNRLNYITLPSTSPANARLSFDEKFERWKLIKEIPDHDGQKRI